MKKIVLSIFLGIYFIFSLFITVCLLSYNNYNVPELFNRVVIVSDDINNYKDGSLIFIKKEKNYKEKDQIFYYDSYVPSLKIDSSSIVSIQNVTQTENTLVLENGRYLSSEFVIGSSIIKIPLLGYLVNIMWSKVGYLMLVILPILLILIYGIVLMVKINKRKEKKDEE